MERKKYKPDSDFEKEIYSDLINRIQAIEDEELSKDFDEKFSSSLNKITPLKPLGMKLSGLFKPFNFKIYFPAGAIVIILIIILLLSIPQKEDKQHNNFVQKDSLSILKQNDSIVKIPYHSGKKNIATENINKEKEQKLGKNDKTVVDNTSKSFAPKMYKPNELNRILKNNDTLKHKDTIISKDKNH